VFKAYPNTRYPAKPEVVLVDKVVMAIRCVLLLSPSLPPSLPLLLSAFASLSLSPRYMSVLMSSDVSLSPCTRWRLTGCMHATASGCSSVVPARQAAAIKAGEWCMCVCVTIRLFDTLFCCIIVLLN
jgi:hypothetical protein